MLQQLNARDHSHRRRHGSPSLSVTAAGVIHINGSGVEHLGATHGDQLLISRDGDSYYIGISKDTNDDSGFVLRSPRETSGNAGLIANSAGVTREIIKVMDLAIAPGKKKSVRLDIHTDPIEHNGTKYFKID